MESILAEQPVHVPGSFGQTIRLHCAAGGLILSDLLRRRKYLQISEMRSSHAANRAFFDGFSMVFQWFSPVIEGLEAGRMPSTFCQSATRTTSISHASEPAPTMLVAKPRYYISGEMSKSLRDIEMVPVACLGANSNRLLVDARRKGLVRTVEPLGRLHDGHLLIRLEWP
jgi:hypothetical protein